MTETTPSSLWFNGEIVPWEQAKVHVWSELAIRGTSIFEGLRAYWHQKEGCYYLLELEEHMSRMVQSARVMRIPCVPDDFNAIRRGIFELILRLDFREHYYVRPTLYIEAGRYGFRPGDVRLGAYVVAFPVPRPKETTTGARVCVSSWRRLSDTTLPPRVKAGASYMSFRLPIAEAKERGLNDAILLNERDKVAETTAATVFLVRGNEVITPPVTAGILESITRKKAIELLTTEFGLEVVERDVDRTELYVADEIFSCGTLSEIQPIVEVDGLVVGSGQPGPITRRVRDRYFEICESGSQAPYGWLTPVLAH